MLLQKIKLKGFKSFPDPVELALERGITAIVGPNGCGKSNIADSINWALGEQSPSSLRGKRMEQMIFNGSSSRKAMGVAEVSVTLTPEGDLLSRLDVSGDDKGLERNGSAIPALLAAGNGEVVITRRMFRDAQSEYLLNGRACRLRDIQDLMMAIGIGSRAVTIVEQDKINLILSSRPVERRVLIEDAAGITKFKLNRHLTQLKLGRASQNLLRIEDLLAEQEVHLRRLRRQAARARRYRRSLAEVREIERTILAYDHAELRRLSDDGSKGVRSLEEQMAAAGAALSEAESAHAELRQRVDELAARQVETRERHYQSSLEIDRDSNRLKHLRDLLEGLFRRSEEAAQRLEEAQRRFDAKGRRLEVAGRRCEEEKQKLRITSDKLSRLRRQADDADADLDALRQKRDKQIAELSESRERLAAENSRGEALLREERRLATVISHTQTVREKLAAAVSEMDDLVSQLEQRTGELDEQLLENAADFQRHKDEGKALQGEIDACDRRIDTLRRSHGNAEATAAALQEMEDRHEGVEEAVRAVLEDEELRSEIRPLGLVGDRIELDPATARAAIAVYGRLLEAVVVEDADRAARGIEMLREKGKGRVSFVPLSGLPQNPTVPPGKHDLRASLRAKDSAGRSLLSIFPQARLVAGIPEALKESTGDGCRLAVTSCGVVGEEGRIVRGGAEAARDQVFTRRIRIGELQRQTELLDKEMADLLGGRRELIRRLDSLAAELEKLRSVGESLRTQRAELGAQKQAAVREKEQREDAVAAKEREGKTLEAQLEESRAQIESLTKKVSELERRIEAASAETKRLDGKMLRGSKAAGRARRGENEVRAEISATDERLKAARATVESLEADRRELSAEIDSARGEVESMEEQRLQHLHEIETIESGMQEKLEANEALKQVLAELEGGIVELSTGLKAREGGVKESRQRLEGIQEELEKNRLAAREHSLALEHLQQRASENLKLDAEELAEISLDGEEFDPEEARQRLEDLKARIERMGPVNMLAGEEYGRHQQRHRFLADQRSDVVDSIASLERVIDRIDRVSRGRFREAFERINENFHNTFRRLFGGGRAELKLEEGDLLEAGVEIMVQPPGKRLHSATLLSGGEKSLAAFAIIMAVLEFRPSPFCILDEADAALDEPNTRRITDILREHSEKTQFILITHNKTTMEIADRLYGVTMEEPGVSKLVSVKFN